MLRQQQPALLQAVVDFAVFAEHRASTAALQAEEQEFGASRGCGFCSVACQVFPLAIAPYPAKGTTGWGSPWSARHWQGSAPLSLGLGTHRTPWDSHLQGLLCTELPGALVTIQDLLETKRHEKLEAA